ncbi:MAG TPA: hypothetical protein VM869_07110 [Enhygromyxa sp.]|nr:hypothetical protein [Enhygromyxa sp.]
MFEASTVKLLIVDGRITEVTEALIREVTGRAGFDGISIWVQGEPLVRGVSRERGQELAARFGSLGCAVQWIDEPRHRFAYDPRHPLRGDQPLRRLRWIDDALAIDHGTLSQWQLGELVSLGSIEALARAVAEQCEAWTREGLAITADERSLLASVSARELRLEAEIRAADDPRDAAGVYTDWLQEQGDPRGRLTSSEPELLERHASHLFGSAASLLPLLELEWCGGVLIGLSNTRPPIATDRGGWRELDVLFELLARPVCACVRSLRVGAGKLVSRDVEERLQAIDPRVREGIRSLYLYTVVGNSFGRCELLPSLEALELTVGLGQPLHFERLRALSVEVSGEDTIAALRESRLPRLDALTLRLGFRGWNNLDALLCCPALLSVRRLVLDDLSATGHPVWIEHGAELIEQLLRAPMIDRLDCLDLRGLSWTHNTLDAIEAVRDRLPQETLVLSRAEIDERLRGLGWDGIT